MIMYRKVTNLKLLFEYLLGILEVFYSDQYLNKMIDSHEEDKQLYRLTNSLHKEIDLMHINIENILNK